MMYLTTISFDGLARASDPGVRHVSSGTGYSYQYVDLAAQERRRLRAEIAELRARATIAHARAGSHDAAAARQLGLDGLSWAVESTDNAALAAKASELRQAVTAAEQAIDRMVANAWATRPSRKTKSAAGTTAAAEFARSAPADGGLPDMRTRAPGALTAGAYAISGEEAVSRAVAAAEALLAAEAHRCTPDDLVELSRLVAAIRRADRAGEARRLRTELESAVHASIDHRKRDEQAAIVRARLLSRAEDALPEDHANLAAAIQAAPDPDDMSGLVDAAVARADQLRQREAVANAAAAALADIGADVGEDFVTMLTARGETAVWLGPDWADGYGLLVSLPDGKTELSTVVVRHPQARTDPDGSRQATQDRAAQRQFCDTGLGHFQAHLGRDGVQLNQIFRTEPGQLPVRPVPEEAWTKSESRESAPSRAKRHPSRVVPAARERSHER
jgi:hypothetical protein